MFRLPRRRPSAAMIIALLALFVALGGPAEAARLVNGSLLKKGSVTGRAVKDRSLTTDDLSKAAVRKLQATPKGSVTEVALANGAVTPGKIARGAVTSGAIEAGGVTAGNLAAGSVRSGQVADGSLNAGDIGRFWGSFSVVLGRDPAGVDHPIPANSCWSGEPVGLAAERAGANISNDVVLVTAGPQLADKSLSITATQSSRPSRFVLIACNHGPNPLPATQVLFNYVIVDVP